MTLVTNIQRHLKKELLIWKNTPLHADSSSWLPILFLAVNNLPVTNNVFNFKTNQKIHTRHLSNHYLIGHKPKTQNCEKPMLVCPCLNYPKPEEHLPANCLYLATLYKNDDHPWPIKRWFVPGLVCDMDWPQAYINKPSSLTIKRYYSHFLAMKSHS